MNFERDRKPAPEFLDSDAFYDSPDLVVADEQFEALGVAEAWAPCRVCGCTRGECCVDELGVYCSRSEPDLCSFCANGRRAVRRARLGAIADAADNSGEPPAAAREAA